MLTALTATIIILLAILALAYHAVVEKVVVGPHEAVILVRNGRDSGRLSTGVHRFFFGDVELAHFELRESVKKVGGQEVLTHDNVPVKFSVVTAFKIVDPERAFHEVASLDDHLHAEIQLVLRELVARIDLDDVLEGRADLAKGLTERLTSAFERVGLRLAKAEVGDIMVGGELKRAFGDVAKARAEGLAKLERARGEAAALRKLANAARLFEEHAGLDRLKTLEVASRAAENYQNTLVIGLDDARHAGKRA